MAVTIGSNISSLRGIRSLDRVSSDLSDTLQRLSSGQRINRASDDAAGLSVSSALSTKSRIYAQGIRNVNDGISMISIAEGALTSLQDIITRVSELAEQASSGTFSGKQRVALDREADSLLKEYNRIIQGTSFNGTRILDGSDDTVLLQHGLGGEQTTRLALGAELGEAAGDGTFGASTAVSTGGTSVYALDSADFNQDGVLDLVVADTSSSRVRVLIGNGDGTFQTSTTFAATTPGQVSTGDVNGDGLADVVTLFGFGSVTPGVFLGNGDGTFQSMRSSPSATVAGASWGNKHALVDINGDSQLDLAWGGPSDANPGVFFSLGDGRGSFGPSTRLGAGIKVNDVKAADFNNDGLVDLIAAEYAVNSVGVYLNNGGSSFAARVSYASGTFPME